VLVQPSSEKRFCLLLPDAHALQKSRCPKSRAAGIFRPPPLFRNNSRCTRRIGETQDIDPFCLTSFDSQQRPCKTPAQHDKCSGLGTFRSCSVVRSVIRPGNTFARAVVVWAKSPEIKARVPRVAVCNVTLSVGTAKFGVL